MKYAFIEEQRAQHSAQRLCRLLGASRSGFYEWLDRAPSARAQANAELGALVSKIHEDSRGRYGRPRIHVEITAMGIRVGAKRVGKLMKAAAISGITPRRFRKTTDSNHSFPVAENILDRKFDVATINKPNQVWAGDITYIPTREGWLYLAVVIDLGSRRVVGWSMKSTMDRSLVIDALHAAINDRKPGRDLMFHSDRGSQYASDDFRNELSERGITQSMSRKGECWDNACVESFFGSLKRELGDPIWCTRSEARAAIFEYIEIWYNRVRRHSTLGYVSPEKYESSLPKAA